MPAEPCAASFSRVHSGIPPKEQGSYFEICISVRFSSQWSCFAPHRPKRVAQGRSPATVRRQDCSARARLRDSLNWNASPVISPMLLHRFIDSGSGCHQTLAMHLHGWSRMQTDGAEGWIRERGCFRVAPALCVGAGANRMERTARQAECMGVEMQHTPAGRATSMGKADF